MNNVLVVGITGPTGSGKSTLSLEFQKNGCELINVDILGRSCIERNSKCVEQLIEYFGKAIILENGKLNRKKLAELAFSSREATDKLNEITHPLILKELKRRVTELKKKRKIVIIDAALLLETGANKLCDYIIAVIAPRDLRLKRIMNRDNLTKQNAIMRIEAQKDDNFYKMNADYILKNNLCHNELKEVARNLFLNLMGAVDGQKDF